MELVRTNEKEQVLSVNGFWFFSYINCTLHTEYINRRSDCQI